MKRTLFFSLVLMAISCNPSKNIGTYFKVSRVEPGKDGQTLYLTDGDGKQYTTVISIPNGNFTEVHQGDTVKLDITEVLDTEPTILITKSVEVLDMK